MSNITQVCTKCHRQFIVIDQEGKFLKDKGLPLPVMCPSDRQLRRLELRGSRTLFKAKCQKCGKDIVVSYDPQTAKNTVYCKEDYERYFQENDPIITKPLPEA